MKDVEVLISLFACCVISLMNGDKEQGSDALDELMKELKKPCYSIAETRAVLNALSDVNIAYATKTLEHLKEIFDSLS